MSMYYDETGLQFKISCRIDVGYTYYRKLVPEFFTVLHQNFVGKV